MSEKDKVFLFLKSDKPEETESDSHNSASAKNKNGMRIPFFENKIANRRKSKTGNTYKIKERTGFLEKRNVDERNFNNGNKCGADKSNGNCAETVESAFYEFVFVEFFLIFD